MKVGLVIDTWKLEIFKRHLIKGGYTYELHPGINKHCTTLTLMTEDKDKFVALCKKANTEAANAVNKQK